MPLTPEQIVAEEFRLRARGYDRDEVDAFLDRLADQVEADTARLGALEQRAAALEAELVAVRERETTLTRTLATVQDAADRARSEAEAEVAELRSATEQELAEARAQAEQEAAEARAQAEQEAEAIRAAAVEE
ncbi:MAG: DivIVA domain-containing protein, partial [Nitriliruptoraceae bacterium]